MTNSRVDLFLSEFVRWASGQSDIVAVALVGSYARGTATTTSDVDLVILTPQANKYLENRQWLGVFGRIRAQNIEQYGPVTSIRVHYEDGLEVEYGLTNEQWVDVPLDEGTHEVIAHGMKILLERGPILSRHAPTLKSRPTRQ